MSFWGLQGKHQRAATFNKARQGEFLMMEEIAPGKSPSTELVFSLQHAGGRDGFSEIFIFSHGLEWDLQ